MTRTTYRPRKCLECEAAFTPRREDQFFCSVPHRKDFDNRCMARGRLLYSLVMTNRYERETETERGIRSMIAKFCEVWRREDMRERGGRKSWYQAERVIDQALQAGARGAIKLALSDMPRTKAEREAEEESDRRRAEYNRKVQAEQIAARAAAKAQAEA